MKRDALLVISCSDRSIAFGHDLRRAGALTLTFSPGIFLSCDKSYH